jgi:hypothetical protein
MNECASTQHSRSRLLPFLMVGLTLSTTFAKPLAGFQNAPFNKQTVHSFGELLSPDEWTLKWVEDTSAAPISISPYVEEKDDVPPAKPERKIVWIGRMEDGSYNPSHKRQGQSTGTPSPHPLRMEQWNITFTWREHRRDMDTTLAFDFNENGFVRCKHPNPAGRSKSRIHGIWMDPILTRLHKKQDVPSGPSEDSSDPPQYIAGTWKLAPSGVTWKVTWGGKTYLFFACVHANPFGRHPKMFRGIVIRDRTAKKSALRKLFRPVVATFMGTGVGTDTGDFTYQNRGMSACIGSKPQ